MEILLAYSDKTFCVFESKIHFNIQLINKLDEKMNNLDYKKLKRLTEIRNKAEKNFRQTNFNNNDFLFRMYLAQYLCKKKLLKSLSFLKIVKHWVLNRI